MKGNASTASASNRSAGATVELTPAPPKMGPFEFFWGAKKRLSKTIFWQDDFAFNIHPRSLNAHMIYYGIEYWVAGRNTSSLNDRRKQSHFKTTQRDVCVGSCVCATRNKIYTERRAGFETLRAAPWTRPAAPRVCTTSPTRATSTACFR